MGVRGEVFSWRASSSNDRRTYFFNLKENRTGDLYLTIVESKKHGEEDHERHQIQVFQEDFDKFRVGIDKVFDHLKEARPDVRRPPVATKKTKRTIIRRVRRPETSSDE